jgi:hypothetical protein
MSLRSRHSSRLGLWLGLKKFSWDFAGRRPYSTYMDGDLAFIEVDIAEQRIAEANPVCPDVSCYCWFNPVE